MLIKKRYLILLGIFLSAFSFSSGIKAKTKNLKSFKNLEISKINQNKNFLEKDGYVIKNTIKENFIDNLDEDSFEKLIANNTDKGNSNDNFLVDIEANLQSQTKNFFNAEGNVILYFSNATLKTDKLTYDRNTKELNADGNIVFSKGDQYFEASNIFYNFKSKKGFIKNVYGVLDFFNFDDDFELNSETINKSEDISNNDAVRNLSYINSSKFGLTTNLSEKEKNEIKDLNIDITSLNKWRFKTDKLNFDEEFLTSERIFFTNDPFNKPQFILLSKNFKGELKKDKTKFVSRNTWINLDNIIKAPIGRWSISDRDKISDWSIGSDYEEKDGFYISRDFEPIVLSDNFSLDLKSYFLIQRAIKDKSNSFREKDSSILSSKVKNDIFLSDLFALDLNLIGKTNSWDVKLETFLNTLNINRSSEAIRSKLTFTRSIDLNRAKKENRKSEKPVDVLFTNYADLEIYSAFREEINRGYAGEAEIYFGNGISLANRKSWNTKSKKTNLVFLYDLGHYKAKSKSDNKLFTASRNLFSASIDNNITLWEKKAFPKEIDQTYKFTPQIIKPSVVWNTTINSGLFFYGDGSSQEGLAFSSGPDLIFGNMKKYLLDFSRLRTRYTYVLKSGDSPFAFDDINSDQRLYFEFEQQVFGPLIFSFQSYLPLEQGHNDYGDFTNSLFKLKINRRAYSLSVFYDQDKKDAGFKFNIFNFDFSGKGKKF